jgi:hypothetical protein
MNLVPKFWTNLLWYENDGHADGDELYFNEDSVNDNVGL